MTSRAAYPEGVPDWLVAAHHASRILDLGSGKGALATMIDPRHDVFCLDHDISALQRLAAALPTATMIGGQVESMPFDACHFDVVTASQNLHRFAPGLALAEIARVLVPGGHLGIAYNTRDDTVPWVRKLTALMQSADPEAMRGDYGAGSVQAVADSAYFTDLERRDFRNWVPITRPKLLEMVSARPGTARLDPADREQLLADVGGLYDSYARVPDPLLLPFQASCWRARVDHTELTVVDFADGLEIGIGF